jgi:phage FluMu protein Com
MCVCLTRTQGTHVNIFRRGGSPQRQIVGKPIHAWNDASRSRRIGRKALELRTGRRNDPSLFSEESGGLGLAKSKSFVHSANKTMFFDNLPLEITCLKCGKLIKETVNWLKAESRKCPFCDTPIDTTEFRRGIDEATNRTHKMLRNLQGSLKSVKINIKL